jgi:hypothetical protein
MYADLSKNGLTVGQKDKNIAIISVEVNSTSELFAKDFTEALVENVSDFILPLKVRVER